MIFEFQVGNGQFLPGRRGLSVFPFFSPWVFQPFFPGAGLLILLYRNKDSGSFIVRRVFNPAFLAPRDGKGFLEFWNPDDH
jgi:hypothetical protein